MNNPLNRTMNKPLTRFLAASALAITALAGAPASVALAADTPAADSAFTSIPAKYANAIVQVKMVMKLPGADEGQEVEVPGTMIESDGLVLVSNAQIGGMLPRMGRPAPALTDVKVLIGDDTEGLKARVWTRASDLDLAWVKIDDEKAKGKKFDAVDLANASTPAPGERIYAIKKLGKFFDRAISVSEGYVAATLKKPRALYLPGGSVETSFGLPVFTADGKVAGIAVVQLPEAEEAENLPRGGFEGPMILPASEVASSTKTAKDAPAPAEPEPTPAPTPKEGEAAPAGDGAKPADAPKESGEKPKTP